ncbi:MAG TPA: amidohydrolase [Firmicutes bacterium]|jgi:amidohydrolase|nr:amidohydrolase [Bacillota bacterium]HOQ24295.1 M20 family metallopeptidase [Bacillota bacterium]HPT67456.1 M20 family metallopeptidase [Bacillota bacterium]
MLAEIRAEAERIAGDLAAIRRHLHQNPELSYKEVNTSAYLSRLLSEWGIKHRIGVGGHGIVADLGPAGKSPKVAFRADMDALPIQEQVQIPFCSTVPGVAHLCGHDAHVAMALGAVRILQNRIGAEGEAIRLLLQPAEELPPGGAEAMIRDGALAGIDSVVALHVCDLPVGQFGLRSGAVTASVDRFQAQVKGRGCHGANPHLGLDPIVIAAGIIQAFQTLVSRTKDPREPAVLSVCRVEAGQQYNILPDTVTMEGTLRAFSPKVREDLLARAERVVRDYPRLFGGEGEWTVSAGHGSVVNDPALALTAARLVEEGWGKEAVVEIPPQNFGEDFANYGDKARLLLVLVGAGPAAVLHSPGFLLDEGVLKEGAAFLAGLMLRLSRGSD